MAEEEKGTKDTLQQMKQDTAALKQCSEAGKALKEAITEATKATGQGNEHETDEYISSNVMKCISEKTNNRFR